MHPADCPDWEYARQPYASAVGIRCEAILNSLKNGELLVEDNLRDTRKLHEQIFLNLTPEKCPYYAGRYRGEKFRCLRFLKVHVRGDPRVGVEPDRVASEMANLISHIISTGIKALDEAFKKPDAELSPADKLFYLVKFCCRMLVEFLRIHPYANGNGHAGRLMVWLLLWRFGYWPKRWPLDERPSYVDLLSRFRDGDEMPLEQFMLHAINGTVSSF